MSPFHRRFVAVLFLLWAIGAFAIALAWHSGSSRVGFSLHEQAGIQMPLLPRVLYALSHLTLRWICPLTLLAAVALTALAWKRPRLARARDGAWMLLVFFGTCFTLLVAFTMMTLASDMPRAHYYLEQRLAAPGD